MMDVNDVFVSSVNRGFDPAEYLDAIGGHRREHDGTIVDTHDARVSAEVSHSAR